MRLAITGAAGGLGRAALARVPSRFTVAAWSHDELPVEDLPSVLDRVLPFRPHAILHLAAMTSVDGCERDPEGAFRANAMGTANVATAAQRAGALLVALSTDYVFDGAKGEPYHEFDEPRPLSVYGRSKLAGEGEARRLAPEHLVVRTSWVFGAGDDFASRAVRALAAGEEVRGIVDQRGTPTYVEHLAERLLPLARSGRRGLVHLAGPEPTTWFEVLSRAKRLGGLPGEVAQQKAGDLNRPAPRPVDSSLTSLVLGPDEALPPLDEGIRELLESVSDGRG